MLQQRSDTDETRILALDTSGRQGTLTLAVGTGQRCEIVECLALPASRRTAQSLLPELDAMLKRVNWNPAQLSLVCVTTGPGSFTGLRIGVTTAKTIAYATGASLVGVHTLLAMAEPIPNQDQPSWTILDAQRQQLFAARHPADWRRQADYQCQTQLLDNQQWLAALCPGELVSGPPLKTLSEVVPSAVKIADQSFWSPKAHSVAKLGYLQFQQGNTIDPIQLVPDYFRKSAAEEKADSLQDP